MTTKQKEKLQDKWDIKLYKLEGQINRDNLGDAYAEFLKFGESIKIAIQEAK